jgi:hypothetical protein
VRGTIAHVLLLATLASSAAAAERAAMQGAGFAKAEEALLAASADGSATGVKALADFYAAHQLWPEALAALARLEMQDAAAEALAAEAHYRLGRFGRVAALTSEAAPVRAFRAMALARRGSFTQAATTFMHAAPPKGFEVDYFLCLAEALIETGDVRGAGEALDRASDFVSANAEQSRRRFLRAKILRANGDESGARSEVRRAAASTPDDWSMRAKLALADNSKDLESLSLAWRSAAFDRNLLMRMAEEGVRSGDLQRALGAYAQVTARFPDSDAALEAQLRAGKVMELLFESADLTPADAARLFFEHVAFAPPGREGDALIRKVSERLKALGLYADAAALLDHQVFQRLRGADRARVAADLAELQIAAGAPEAALAAIRTTRIAGLEAEANARRRRLEATALGAIGRREAALALLEGSKDPADVRLRAAIAWDGGFWPQAAADYSLAFAAAPASLSREDREAAVRAATAFLLAGDRAGYRAFVADAAPRLEGTREEAMIRSLGDLDRDAFLDRFMETYRALYGAAAGR